MDFQNPGNFFIHRRDYTRYYSLIINILEKGNDEETSRSPLTGLEMDVSGGSMKLKLHNNFILFLLFP